jgi:hypothetical protein
MNDKYTINEINSYRSKKREYLKGKINELAMNGKNNTGDLYRGINEFRMGYQPRSKLAKVENGDLLADSHSILNRWKNYFSLFFNVHRVSDGKQIDILTAEPLVPDLVLVRLKLLLQS